MDSVVQIFKNLAKDDDARRETCRFMNTYTSSCDDVACSKCPYKNHESMQRAANTLKNRLGG